MFSQACVKNSVHGGGHAPGTYAPSWHPCPPGMHAPTPLEHTHPLAHMPPGMRAPPGMHAVADPGGLKVSWPPSGPVKISHKKDGRIDFMFLAPLPGHWIRYWHPLPAGGYYEMRSIRILLECILVLHMTTIDHIFSVQGLI